MWCYIVYYFYTYTIILSYTIIILYITIIISYTLLYYYILYIILFPIPSSPLLLYSSFPSYPQPSLLFFPRPSCPSQYSFYTCRYLDTHIYILSSFPSQSPPHLFLSIPLFPIFNHSSSFSPLLLSSQYSFYTCRELHILIYIPSFPISFSSPINNLTPHVLSEWMVEVCGA